VSTKYAIQINESTLELVAFLHMSGVTSNSETNREVQEAVAKEDEQYLLIELATINPPNLSYKQSRTTIVPEDDLYENGFSKDPDLVWVLGQ